MDPIKRKKLDEMLNALVHIERKDSFEHAVKSFLSEEFSPLMGSTLLDKYKQQMHIKDLNTLSPSQQTLFIENMINKVFTRIRTPEQMNFIRLHYYIKLSVKEGSQKLTQMLGKQVLIDTVNIKKMSTASLLEFVEMVSKEVFIVKVVLSDFIEGSAYVLLFRNSASVVADLMTAGMQHDAFAQFDENRISAVREFMNMTISSYSDAIANILGGKLYFIIQPVNPFDMSLFVNDIKEQVFLKGDQGFEKIFTANLDFEIGGFDRVQGIMLLLLEKSPEVMKTFLSKKKMAEVKLETAFAGQTQDAEQDAKAKEEAQLQAARMDAEKRMLNFMLNHFDEDKAKSIIATAKKLYKIEDLNKATTQQKEDFAYKLIEIAFSDQSKAKISIFQTAILDAIGFNVAAAIQSSSADKEEQERERLAEEEKKRKEAREKKKDQENIMQMVDDGNG